MLELIIIVQKGNLLTTRFSINHFNFFSLDYLLILTTTKRFGFFPHHKSCDKYYSCENGTATLKVCGNGLVFDDADSTRENCAYPFSVDCGDRTDLGNLYI